MRRLAVLALLGACGSARSPAPAPPELGAGPPPAAPGILDEGVWSAWPDEERRRATLDAPVAEEGLVAEHGLGPLRLRDDVRAIAWSRDGRVVAATGGLDVRLWDAGGAPFLVLTPPAATSWPPESFYTELAFSPTGRHLAVAGTRDVHVVDLETLAWTTLPRRDPLLRDPQLAWGADEILAVGDDAGVVRTWRPATQDLEEIARGEGRVVDLAWSPDGESLAVQHGDGFGWDGGSLDLVEVATGASRPIEVTPAAIDLEWSPDSAHLAARSFDVLVIEPGSGTVATTLTHDHGGDAVTTAWSPDGALLATTGADGRLRITRIADGVERATAAAAPESLVAWSPDGTRLATAQGNALSLWTPDLAPIDLGVRHLDEIQAVVASDDGAIAALDLAGQLVVWSPDGAGRVVDARSGTADPRWDHRGVLESSVLATGGDALLLARRTSAAESHEVTMWDWATGAERERHPLDTWVSALAMAPGGRPVARVAQDAIATIASSGKANRRSFPEIVAIAPGRVVAVTRDEPRQLSVVGIAGKPKHRLDLPASFDAECVFSRDGGTIACVGAAGIGVAEAASGKRLAQIEITSPPRVGLVALPELDAVAVAAYERVDVYGYGGERIASIAQCKDDRCDAVRAVAVVPLAGGEIGLAVAGTAGVVRVWNLSRLAR